MSERQSDQAESVRKQRRAGWLALCGAVVLGLWAAGAAGQPSAAQLAVEVRAAFDRSLADAEGNLLVATNQGHTGLIWGLVEGEGGEDLVPEGAVVEYQLEYGPGEDFGAAEEWYRGAGRESFVSGLEPGLHVYRVRARLVGGEGVEPGPWGPWSEALRVEVEYQSMRLAWGLFATGAAMFGAIVAFVVWQTVRGSGGEGAGPGRGDGEVRHA